MRRFLHKVRLEIVSQIVTLTSTHRADGSPGECQMSDPTALDGSKHSASEGYLQQNVHYPLLVLQGLLVIPEVLKGLSGERKERRTLHKKMITPLDQRILLHHVFVFEDHLN